MPVKGTKKKSAVNQLKAVSEKKKPAIVTADELNNLKNYDDLVAQRRMHIGALVEQVLANVDFITQVRTLRANQVSRMAESYGIDPEQKWAVDPTTHEIVFTDK